MVLLFHSSGDPARVHCINTQAKMSNAMDLDMRRTILIQNPIKNLFYLHKWSLSYKTGLSSLAYKSLIMIAILIGNYDFNNRKLKEIINQPIEKSFINIFLNKDLESMYFFIDF